MTHDWRDALQQIGNQIAATDRKGSLGQTTEHIDAGAFNDALMLLGPLDSPEARSLAVRAHYGLLKVACAEEAYGRARDHAVKAMNLAQGSMYRGLRALIQQRLELLARCCITPPSRRKVAQPVFANVGRGVGHVPVLGIYTSYGIGGGALTLNDIIMLLKRGVDELDPREEREREHIIPILGQGLAYLLSEVGLAHGIDLIIPVPADPDRAAARGYSPQEVLAQEIGSVLAIPTRQDIVRQKRSTQKLQHLSPAERSYELADVFDVATDKVHFVYGMHILLVDDVVTYGTHFHAVSQVLKVAGAVEVRACAIATGRDNLCKVA